MAPEISLAKQRPAQYVFSQQVQKTLTELNAEKAQKAARRPRRSAAKAAAAREPASDGGGIAQRPATDSPVLRRAFNV